MNLEFGVCNKCKTVDYKTIINELKTLYPDASFSLKCQSFCGPGSIKPFVSINEVFIEAETTEELLQKIKKHVG